MSWWPVMAGGLLSQRVTHTIGTPLCKRIRTFYHTISNTLRHCLMFFITEGFLSVLTMCGAILCRETWGINTFTATTIASLTTYIYSLLWKLAFIFQSENWLGRQRMCPEREREREEKMRFNKMMIDEAKLRFVQYLSGKVQIEFQLDFKQ